MIKKSKLIFIGLVFFALPFFVSADSLGERNNFYVDSSYDLENRDSVSATLRVSSQKLYFYIDDSWWQSLDFQGKQKTESSLRALDNEFYYKIYPVLTSAFGTEWKPGIDKDDKITVLIHPMREGARGYFNSGDEYPKIMNPRSNEREMIYLDINSITDFLAKSFLAHEFMHLITFNQKEKIYEVEEGTWLNEARAEYTPTFLGYDSIFEGSNLEKRVKTFLSNPSDSIPEWLGEEKDYGVLNIFTQYLVEKYGIEILVDSLKSGETGIKSINTALKNNNFEEDFSQIFTDWIITVALNDCSLGKKYCYESEELKGVRISPVLVYIPFTGENTLVSTYPIKEWSGNWYKIIGGRDGLKLEFSGTSEVNFKLPYLLQDNKGKISISFLELNDNQKGELQISDFGESYSSLTLIPSIQSKTSDFTGAEPFHTFSWKISVVKKENNEEELISQLLAQIDFLKKEIVKVQAQIQAILAGKGKSVSCQQLTDDLYYGMRNDYRVSCLQEFLANPSVGGPEIYPEGLVTGNFLSLTRAAVIRFQEKYTKEILIPLGLEKGTGYVGEMTRAKLNELSVK